MAETNPFTKTTTDVVPAGLKWTSDNAEKAAADNTFLRVGGEKVTKRVLSGGPRSWSSDDPAENRTIFNVTFRITGVPEHVTSALKYAGYDDSEIKAAVIDSITKDNYQNGKKKDYDEELERHTIGKQNKQPAEYYEDSQIIWFATNLKDAKSVSKKAAPKAPDASASSKPKVVGAKTLATRIENLKETDLLDVSDMTDDFKKINVRPVPKTNKSGKHYSRPLPFMSNDLNKYKKVIEHHYGVEGLTTYAANIEEVKNKLEGLKQNVPSNIPQPASHPATKPVTSVQPVTNKSTVPRPQTSTVPVVSSPKRIGTIGGGGFPVVPSIK